MAEISVIMPVYNANTFLDDSTKSVLSQSYDNLELILVDDGSTDASAAKCDALAQTDTRVRVCHKENGGPSSARNRGLEEAQGAFCLFMDADDTLAPGALAQMYQKATERPEQPFDVVSAGYTLVYPDSEKTFNHPAFAVESPQGWAPHAESYFCSLHALALASCKLLRTGLVAENGLRFDESLHIGEDIAFFCRLFAVAQRVANLDVSFYHYQKRDAAATLTSKPRLDGMEDAALNVARVSVLLRHLGCDKEAAALLISPAHRGYQVYYYQLNHPMLKIPFRQHRRRLRDLLEDAEAREQLLAIGQGPTEQTGAATRISGRLIKWRMSFWLTVFIRAKSAALRRRMKKSARAAPVPA